MREAENRSCGGYSLAAFPAGTDSLFFYSRAERNRPVVQAETRSPFRMGASLKTE